MCRAAAQKRALYGRYLFKNHGELRVNFSPHTMVRTPRRIHFRGHLLVFASGEAQDWGYVDLVPGRFHDDDLRILKEQDYKYRMREESGYRGADGDREWHEETDLAFQINPELPPHAYFALQQEHGPQGRPGRTLPPRIKGTEGACLFVMSTTFSIARLAPSAMKAWIRCQATGWVAVVAFS